MKFCSRPFKFIHLDPNGGCRLCAWTDISIGDLTKKSVEEVWNSEEAEKVREAIRNGNYEYCRKTSCPFLENDSLPEVDEKDAKNYEAEPIPTQYSVACDFTCNHKCPSCRNEIFKPNDEYKNNLEIILNKILPYLNSDSTEKILTDGNGDCFASPYIMKMLENLHPKNEECHIIFETNGAFLDEEHWKRIKHLEKYWLQVTVTPNSFIKSTFEYLNGGVHSYEQVMKNLIFIRDLRSTGILNWVKISIVLQEKNFWEFPEFAKKCLDDFKADEVVAKPLYKWFMLSEDDYWFKDVLNPLHPYHKEYLKMLENPILKDERIFYWGANNLHEPRRHPAYFYEEQNKIIRYILDDGTQNFKENIQQKGITDVYLYGDNTLTVVFYKKLHEMNINIKGILVRDKKNKKCCGVEVQCLKDYTPSQNDTIIVMNYNYIRQIVRDLHFKGFTGRIINAKELTDIE